MEYRKMNQKPDELLAKAFYERSQNTPPHLKARTEGSTNFHDLIDAKDDLV